MPPINHAAMSAGVIAVSVVAAAAIAVYESPELQRMAQDLRRRIAIALHQFGDSISPQERENLFNRPEDAEGFLRSRGLGPDAEPGIDADDETRRRQREELMYWNAQREQRQRSSTIKTETTDENPNAVHTPRSPGTHFDQFLKHDAHGEKGSYVFHTGSQVQDSDAQIRRRGEAARGLDFSRYANPFSDEHGMDDSSTFADDSKLIRPENDEVSDIYSATDIGRDDHKHDLSETLRAAPPVPPKSPLVDVTESQTPTLLEHESPRPSERELGPDEFMTAGQDHEQQNDAYSSIQAWAQGSSAPTSGFYSPLPVSPEAPLSEAELVSEAGQMTPTDSASLAGSAAHEVAHEDAASVSVLSGSHASRDDFDVVSDDGMMTPASWSEVGSVVSENEPLPTHA